MIHFIFIYLLASFKADLNAQELETSCQKLLNCCLACHRVQCWALYCSIYTLDHYTKLLQSMVSVYRATLMTSRCTNISHHVNKWRYLQSKLESAHSSFNDGWLNFTCNLTLQKLKLWFSGHSTFWRKSPYMGFSWQIMFAFGSLPLQKVLVSSSTNHCLLGSIL